jgi:hypothetical protein
VYAYDKGPSSKRKRGAFTDYDMMSFTHMTEVVKDVAEAIRENNPTNVHPRLYESAMEVDVFTEDTLLATLDHLFINKDQDTHFTGMVSPHRILWSMNHLAKKYYNM